MVSENSPSDVDLHIRVVQGDQSALVEIDGRYRARVMAWAEKKGLPTPDAEEAWNDALDAFWSRAGELRQVGEIRPYLFGVVANKVTDHFRSKHRAVVTKEMDEVAGADEEDATPAMRDRPLSPRVAECLADLRPEYRTTVDLVVLRQMEVKEAAAVMGSLPNTVSQWKRRALEQLAKCLKEDCDGG